MDETTVFQNKQPSNPSSNQQGQLVTKDGVQNAAQPTSVGKPEAGAAPAPSVSQTSLEEAPTLYAQQTPSLEPAPVIPTPVASSTPSPYSISPPPEMPRDSLTPPSENGGGGFSFPSLGLLLKIGGGLLVVILLIFFVSRLFIGGKQTAKNEKATITYWGLWEDNNVMQKIIDDFHKENPSITVNYVKQDIHQYRERLTTRIVDKNGENAPDVFLFHNSWVPELSGVLAPLSQDATTSDEFKKSFYPVASRDLGKAGAMYGIPSEIDTLAMFVNTDSLKAATHSASVPTDWNDFITLASDMTIKDTNNKITKAGAALGTYNDAKSPIIQHAADILSALFIQNGVDLTNPTNTQNYLAQTLTFYTSFAQGENAVWDDALGNSIDAFAAGNVGMTFGYSWDVLRIKAENKDLHFSIYPIPHLPGKNMTIASYWANGVSIKSQYSKQAMLFVHYLAQKETEQSFYTETAKTRLFGEPYARADLGSTLKDNPLIYPFVAQAPDAASSYFASDTYDDGLNDHANQYLVNAVNSMFNNTSSDTAAQTLASGLAQVLGQYGK